MTRDVQAAPGDHLGPGVRHVRCDNPGPMTLSGTNTYLVTVDGGFLVIDPGPDDAAHREALIEAVGEATRVDVLVTHHHDDHEGGVAALVGALAGCGVDVRRWGGADSERFVDGQMFDDVQVIAAPGHTADSVAFILERDGQAVLFSGDTLLGGSSSFIAHPDGDLTAYLVTLDVLEAAVSAHPDAMLAPGHGHVGDSAVQVISDYRAHREQRLAEVRRVLETWHGDAGGRVDAVIEGVYGDIGADLRPAVEAIVLAQLAHLDRVAD